MDGTPPPPTGNRVRLRDFAPHSFKRTFLVCLELDDMDDRSCGLELEPWSLDPHLVLEHLLLECSR